MLIKRVASTIKRATHWLWNGLAGVWHVLRHANDH